MKEKGDHDLPVHRSSRAATKKTGRPLMKLVGGIEQGGIGRGRVPIMLATCALESVQCSAVHALHSP